MSEAPLNYEASAGTTNLQVSRTLPSEVVQCLENARFVRSHLLPSITSSSQTHTDGMNHSYISPHAHRSVLTSPS